MVVDGIDLTTKTGLQAEFEKVLRNVTRATCYFSAKFSAANRSSRLRRVLASGTQVAAYLGFDDELAAEVVRDPEFNPTFEENLKAVSEKFENVLVTEVKWEIITTSTSTLPVLIVPTSSAGTTADSGSASAKDDASDSLGSFPNLIIIILAAGGGVLILVVAFIVFCSCATHESKDVEHASFKSHAELARKSEEAYPDSQEDFSASRPPVIGIELPVRSFPTATHPTTHKRELSEADLLIQDLVDSHLPDPSIDDNEDSQSDKIDVVTQSSTTLVDDIAGDSAPSVNDLVNQAIAGVPFPDEFPPEKAYALDGTDGMSPRTGSQAEAFVDGVISNITDGGDDYGGKKEIPEDSGSLGDGTLGIRAQTLLEQVVTSSVQDLDTFDS